MVQMIGAMLVASATAYIGFHCAAQLNQRVNAMRQLEEGLSLLEQELELCQPPLPELMEQLTLRCRGAAKQLFQGCTVALEQLEQESFSISWRRLIEEQQLLGQEGQACLYPLGDSLGRCGWEEQRQAICAARRHLEAVRTRAEEDSRRTGKVYRTLGVSGGAFFIILML